MTDEDRWMGWGNVPLAEFRTRGPWSPALPVRAHLTTDRTEVVVRLPHVELSDESLPGNQEWIGSLLRRAVERREHAVVSLLDVLDAASRLAARYGWRGLVLLADAGDSALDAALAECP